MSMIPPDTPPPDGLLDAFDLAEAAFLAETPLAAVWRVRREPGGYDLANAFRNPKGGDAAVWWPERLTRLAGLAATALNTDPTRMLDWAAAKCALSIAWRGGRAGDPELTPLSRLLDLAKAAGTRNGRPR